MPAPASPPKSACRGTYKMSCRPPEASPASRHPLRLDRPVLLDHRTIRRRLKTDRILLTGRNPSPLAFSNKINRIVLNFKLHKTLQFSLPQLFPTALRQSLFRNCHTFMTHSVFFACSVSSSSFVSKYIFVSFSKSSKTALQIPFCFV